MNKLDNWDVHLVEFATEMRGEEFKWGLTDCANMVAYALEIMYGSQIELPSLQTKKEILKLYAIWDQDIVKYLQSLGAKQIELLMCRGGDVVIFDTDEIALGICTNSSQIMMSDEEGGVQILPKRIVRIRQVMRFP